MYFGVSDRLILVIQAHMGSHQDFFKIIVLIDPVEFLHYDDGLATVISVILMLPRGNT